MPNTMKGYLAARAKEREARKAAGVTRYDEEKAAASRKRLREFREEQARIRAERRKKLYPSSPN